MAPETHLFGSWIIAAKTTRNVRDCRLVTLAGIIPDADGLGLIVDLLSGRTMLYHQYHHLLLHGLFGALMVSGLLAMFARERWRVFLLALAVFHLHILWTWLVHAAPHRRIFGQSTTSGRSVASRSGSGPGNGLSMRGRTA